MSTCPSDLAFDEYWLAGRPPEHPIARHLQDCTACARRIRENERIERYFEREVLPVTSAAVRAAAVAPRRFGHLQLACAALAACLLVVATIGLVRSRDALTLTYKGIGLEVYCLRGGAVLRLNDGDRLRPDDRLRFAVTAPSAGYLMIVSRGATGLERYFPPEGPAARQIESGRTELEGSVILDDAPGEERIVALFGAAPFDFAGAEKALGAAPDGASPNLSLAALVFHKDLPLR